jgi:hypothetical protein
MIVNRRWKFRAVRGKADKGICPFYVGKKDVKPGQSQ